MKKMANRYKDLSVPIKKEELFEEFLSKQPTHLQKTVKIDDVVLTKDGNGVQLKGASDPKLLDELDQLKENEAAAREEILRLQDVIRMIRTHYKLKEVLQKDKHQFQIDNLRQQLTSNTTLWEQLAESEKREKILKQEVERAQQEIATQEKIIERLKDDIKREGVEKQKLLQFRNTKSKRLNELEAKAREFEVLSSVNLSKILTLLEQKEKKITELQRSEDNTEQFVQAMGRLNKQEMGNVRRKAKEESNLKVQAMAKLETLRQELQMIQGNDQVSVNFWKEQCQSLFEICRNLKDDNERLVSAIADKPHPLDQFNNNQDLLAYLSKKNEAQLQAQAAVEVKRAASKKAESKQQEYEKLAFGMERSLQDAMLGKNINGRNKHSMSLNVRKNNYSSNPNYGGGPGKFQTLEQPSLALPTINTIRGSKHGGMIAGSDSSVLLGNLPPGAIDPPRLLGAPSPFVGKLPQIVRPDNVFSTLQADRDQQSLYSNG